MLNVRDFGARGNGTDDDYPAFRKALDTLDVTFRPSLLLGSGGTLLVPPGEYWLSQTLKVRQATSLQGAGITASVLRFASPDLPSNATLAGVLLESAYSSVRNLTVSSDRSFNSAGTVTPRNVLTDDEQLDAGAYHSGITLRRGQCLIENCFIHGFEHDGITIHPLTSIDSADSCLISRCAINENGRHGTFICGTTIGVVLTCVSCGTNRGFGFFDRSKGNTYVGCLAQGNGVRFVSGGGYCIRDGFHSLLGCVEEQDQYDEIGSSTVVIGGLVGQTGRTTSIDSQYQLGFAGGLTMPTVLGSRGDFTAEGVRSSGVYTTVGDFSVMNGSVTTLLASPPQGIEVKVTLPNTSTKNSDNALRGYTLTVKKVNGTTGTICVSPAASTQRIDGVSQISITDQYDWVTLTWGLDSWHIVGRG